MLNAGVSWGTLNTLVPALLKLGIVAITRKIGRATLYKINLNNPIVRQFVDLYDSLIRQQLERIEEKKLVVA